MNPHLKKFYTDLRRDLGQEPLTVEAPQRLLAFKKPSVEFLDKNHDKILNAIDALRKWYKDNADRGMTAYIPLLMKAFDYDPYTKKVYRAFPIPTNIEAKVGRSYKIPTGLKAVQSWTTSAKIAEDFINKQDYKTKNYGIFELKDEADQLCNYKWIRQVVEYLIEECKKVDDLYEIYMDARQLLNHINEFEHEQEIILKLPGEAKVRLVKILE